MFLDSEKAKTRKIRIFVEKKKKLIRGLSCARKSRN